MSEIHLGKGSEKPAKIDGKLRLYGMLFCPFVLRVRLVLLAKKIPHDIVYVDLQNKPEWLFEMNPKGQVPVLDDGAKIITESLEICYYLEKKFSETELLPTDPELLKNNEELIAKIDDAIKIFYQTLSMVGKKTLKDVLGEVQHKLDYFEEALAKKGSFFNGPNVGFADFMAWPWVEKLPIFNMIFNETTTVPEKYEKLKTWREKMLELEPVQKTLLDIQKHFEYTVFVKQRNTKNVNDLIK